MQTGIRTFSEGLQDRRLGAMFLGALGAIPVAGIFGLPLLLFLLLFFGLNPAGLGQRFGQCRCLKNIPGFRSGRRMYTTLASVFYLLPISLLGMVVVGVDGMILRTFL